MRRLPDYVCLFTRYSAANSYQQAKTESRGRMTLSELTLETIEDLRAEIPWERLPKRLRDVSRITRGLGIRYLWVDALCITSMQEPSTEVKEDWAHQSAQVDANRIHCQATIVLWATFSMFAEDGLAYNPYQFKNFVDAPTHCTHFGVFGPGQVFIALVWRS